MGEIGQGLEKDLDHHAQVVVGRVELVKLQQRKVGLQVITLLPGLEIHIVLQSLDVLGVVSLNPLKHRLNLGLHAFHDNGYANVLLCKIVKSRDYH